MKSSYSVFLSALVFTFSCISFAADEGVSCPTVKVGTIYKYKTKKDGYEGFETIEVTNVGENVIEAKVNGRALSFDKIFNPIGEWEGRTLETKLYYVPECPFKFGETRQHEKIKYTLGNGTELSGKMVVSADTQVSSIKVAAGDFQVVRLNAKISANWSARGFSGYATGAMITDYAPNIGAIVRTEFRSSGGETIIRELVEIRPGQ